MLRQCNKATKTEITLGANYNADRQAGNLIEFLNWLRTICFRSDHRGLSFGPYKQVVEVKSTNNYSNNKPHDPHGFKKEVKIKYNAVNAVAGRFPNGTAAIMTLLEAEAVPLTSVDYHAMPPVYQLV